MDNETLTISIHSFIPPKDDLQTMGEPDPGYYRVCVWDTANNIVESWIMPGVLEFLKYGGDRYQGVYHD